MSPLTNTVSMPYQPPQQKQAITTRQVVTVIAKETAITGIMEQVFIMAIASLTETSPFLDFKTILASAFIITSYRKGLQYYFSGEVKFSLPGM